ncbi:MAG: 30S ribosomal protein S2 [Actinobacteria bacterium]|nr:30S ribosomal protein S2 [Actinomycetota bacterium]
MESIVTMRQLLEVGVHFGHQTRRWNPKMKRYIYAEKNGIYIIDLQQTLQLLIEAFEHVKNIASNDGLILFVGTKKQIQDIIEENATNCGMPYVRNRWLGGTLTNFKTISARTKRIAGIEEMEKSGTFEMLPKTEVLQIKKEYEKLLYNMGGIRHMKRMPDLMFVIDPHKEAIAVEEAKKIGIPIVGIVDTNCDPDKVDYIIPGNDDAIRSCGLICGIISEAVKRGRAEAGLSSVTVEKTAIINTEILEEEDIENDENEKSGD